MIILGIESSANKVGVGIAKKVESSFRELANVRATYTTPPGFGFLPKETATHHRNCINKLVSEALKTAKLKPSDIDFIAYTKGPGMAPCLLVGALVARTLSLIWKVPLIPVNHCVAHIEMGRIVCNSNNPVILYASGGNSQIIGYSKNRYRIYGETIDIAVGNALDRFARSIKLPNNPAGGWWIEQLALRGRSYIELPYVIKGMDVSFSGLLSFIESYAKKHEISYSGPIIPEELVDDWFTADMQSVADLCYSLQETAFAMMVETTERVMALTQATEILCVGGVGCNLRLQEMLKAMASERNAILNSMDDRYCIDNGLMIAWTAILHAEQSEYGVWEDCTVTQRYRTDQVPINWR
eukprot:NODE_131_length_18300_cov_0.442668.p7 type:complete len:355 gc:universal NODE_131_length_18300_cov_0.442668:4844-3780(-)